ncbi:MAG TPA: head GIN domain-containing protein [Chitinophagaceae bacterium]
MRKIFLFTTCLLLVSSLSVNVFSQDQKEENKENDRPKIKGSGNVVTRDVTVQAFDQLEAKGVFNVSLIQGSKEAVKIEAEDNLQDLFEIQNEGSKLIVSMKKDVRFDSKKRMVVYITFKNIKSLDLKMVGNFTSEGNLSFDDLSLENTSVGNVELDLHAQKLDVINKSVGNLKLSGKAENAVIRNSSVGAIRAGDLMVQTMDIDNNGIGSAEVNAAKQLIVKDSFLGKVRNVGGADIKKKVVI